MVDNASTDGSLEDAVAAFPWITTWRNPANWGFARGYVAAVAAAPGPYVVLLNSDTRVRPGWLRSLVDAAEADPRLGAASAKLIFPPDSPNAGRIQNAGGLLLRDGSGRDRGTAVRDGRVEHEPDRGQYDRQEEVFYFNGAAALLRKAALADAGSLDPRYFMYYEDLDLSWRLRLRAWKVLYVPDAVVEHEHAASSGEWSPLFLYKVLRNRPLMLMKLAPWPLALREMAATSPPSPSTRPASCTGRSPVASAARTPPGRASRAWSCSAGCATCRTCSPSGAACSAGGACPDAQITRWMI